MDDQDRSGSPSATTSSKEVPLTERLDQIRSSPKLQSQQQTSIVLSAVEDTLKEQKSDFTPTAYFAALLSLLHQYVSSTEGIINKDVATAIVYLLDLVTGHVPNPVLRSKFGQILQSLSPALNHSQADAPFLRSSIGCLVSLLVAQDAQAWALPQSQIGPRKAMAGLLALALDHRPKVRKRAQDGVAKVLQTKVPSPLLDHPAAEMCAETALRSFQQLASAAGHMKKSNISRETYGHEPELIHAMQLVKTIARASKGWPTRNLDSLCEVLFAVARSKVNYLTTTAFEVFEAILEGITADESASKIPHLLDAIFDMKPSLNDSQLLPPWIAIVSRAYDVYAQVEPEDTFQKLPSVFETISNFFASPSFNIRVSASECLVSFLVNCVPVSVLLEPSVYDEKVIEKLGAIVNNLMTVKYQSAWMEVFTVVGAMFDHLMWQAWPVMSKPLAAIGDLRASDSFAGKEQADQIISKAIKAIGPENVLSILPLNLATGKKGTQGRAWLMPLLRDSVSNTNLSHFRKELVPLSEKLFQKVVDHGQKDKTVEIKIFETLVQQIWACLPGYCDRPLDVKEAFDQDFAEMIGNLLYQQPEMRDNLCRALQTLVDNYKAIADLDDTEEEDLILQGRISKSDAKDAILYLSNFSSNLLAILFNVYTETLPQKRGPVLRCIDSYLSITSAQEVSETFEKVATMLDAQLKEAADKPRPKPDAKGPPPVSHALMDLIVAIAVYIPRQSFQNLFSIAAAIISQQNDASLQKKAYKLIPRLAQSEIGKVALTERSSELQNLLLQNKDNTMSPAKKDRLRALSAIAASLPPSDLYFIPAILSEVILGTKEANEKAREDSYDLLVLMATKMQAGGTIENSRVSFMPSDAQTTPASLEEYFTMLSAGLAGSTPFMISATIQAISRILYQFHADLSDTTINDLIQTMDLFLTSPTREVVRSVLGFVKICIVILPSHIIKPRLSTLIPGILNWSAEHKAHFRTKVKNILERIIRHYGFEVVDKYTGPDDKKFINNIRKTRERAKRKKKGNALGDDDASMADGNEEDGEKKQSYGNEFDEAIYGSDDSDSEADDDEDGDAVQLRDPKKNGPRSGKDRSNSTKRGQATYIHEDADEPLDLLDRKAMAHISSTKPQNPLGKPKKLKAQYDHDGKLLLRDDKRAGNGRSGAGDDGDDDMLDAQTASGSLESGINAYVQAIRGRDAPIRGRGGRLKFKQNRKGAEEDVEMDDGEEQGRVKKSGKGEIARSPRAERGGARGGGGRGGRGGRGGGGAKFPARRSLGGRIDKRGMRERG